MDQQRHAALGHRLADLEGVERRPHVVVGAHVVVDGRLLFGGEGEKLLVASLPVWLKKR